MKIILYYVHTLKTESAIPDHDKIWQKENNVIADKIFHVPKTLYAVSPYDTTP